MRTLSVLALLLSTWAAQAQPVRVLGTRALLEAPTGYRPADGFAGFQADSLQAALMVIELPGALLAEAIAGMTPEGFRAQGILNAARQDATVNGAPAILVTGTQAQAGTTFAKWILVTGDSVGVILINATIPKELAQTDGLALERAVMSLTWGDESPSDLFEGLGFTLDLPDGLPDRARAGAALSLGIRTGPGASPLYVAARGTGRLPQNLAPVAEARIRQTATLTDVGQVQGRAVVIDGRAGYEAVAQGTEESSGTPVMTYLVFVPDVAATYTVFQGIAGADQADEWIPLFRATTESVRWEDR